MRGKREEGTGKEIAGVGTAWRRERECMRDGREGWRKERGKKEREEVSYVE